MIPLFIKPMNDILAEHVKQLIDEEVPEGQHVEYKKTLPSDEQKGDPWLEEGKKVGNEARNKILAEVVAFANAEGGTVVVGIEETDDHPKRAKKINHLPKCHDLADRFRHAVRDCIDPQLPTIEVFSVETSKRPKGSGVVVFRVPASRLSPHRLNPTREVLIRRADRTEKMTMREVQDQSIKSASLNSSLESMFEGRREVPGAYIRQGALHSTNQLAIRITAAPTRTEFYIDRVYEIQNLFGPIQAFDATVQGQKTLIQPPKSVDSINQYSARPILRGGRRSSEPNENFSLVLEVFGNGLIELFFTFRSKNDGNPVFMDWLLGLVANALKTVDVTRQIAGAPSAEFALDIEILSSVTPPLFVDLSARQYLGVGEIDRGTLSPNPLRLPIHLVASSEEFSSIVRNVMNDLREAAGLRAVDDFEVHFD